MYIITYIFILFYVHYNIHLYLILCFIYVHYNIQLYVHYNMQLYVHYNIQLYVHYNLHVYVHYNIHLYLCILLHKLDICAFITITGSIPRLVHCQTSRVSFTQESVFRGCRCLIDILSLGLYIYRWAISPRGYHPHSSQCCETDGFIRYNITVSIPLSVDLLVYGDITLSVDHGLLDI